MSITESFSKATSKTSESFTIVYFKRLLLDFIVNNNISFRVIITPSFKKLL
jgi:Zn-dependent M16 (insulinase) family peptidase